MKKGILINPLAFNLFKRQAIALILMVVLSLFYYNANAVTKTSVATGNWSASGTWSPAGVPASGDNVIIHGGNVVTVDGAYTCNSIDIGDATAGVTTVTVSLANSLTINGDLRINPSNKANTYTLDAAAGTINVAGTFSTWGTTNTNTIKVSTGTINFTPAITIASTTQNITFTGAGTINFNSNYTDNVNKLVTFAGCTANFAGNYTVGTTNETWAAKGMANFTSSGKTITPNANITFNNVQFAGTASTTLASGAGTVIFAGTYTLSSGSTFTANQNFEVDGNWTNNGGTLSAGSNTIILNGTAQGISGTASTSFPNIQIGISSAVTVAVTISNSNSCNNVVFAGFTNARTLTVAAAATLTIGGDVTINQPTGAVANTLAVGAGTCSVAGNLNFVGASNTTTQVAKVSVSTGSFTLNGNVSWMSNTAVTTEVITTTGTGSITFGSPVTMGTGSGTLSATSTGTINFNGTTSTSFVFGGAVTAPVFTTTNGCTLNFKAGFTNNTNALTLAATSNSIFTGAGSFTANANTTFGNVQITAADTFASSAGTVIVAGTFTLANSSAFVANQSFELNGAWTNNGGTMAGSDTVIFNKTTTIGGTSPTTFQGIQIGQPGNATNVTITMNTANSCANLMFSAAANLRTLTLAAAASLTASGDLTMNQPTAAVGNTLAVGTASCTINGNLNFIGTASVATQLATVSVSTGTLSINGNVSWMANTTIASEVITVTSTGTINFGHPVTMGTGSGTISATSTGTIKFNGTTSTSFVFGGSATAPVFTTTNGCKVYFARGFTNNTTAYTFAATSTVYFSGNGSLTANANITFGNVQINAADTFASSANAIIVAGTFTLANGSVFVANQSFEVNGNWTNSGGTMTGNDTVTFNKTSTIAGTAPTTFQGVQIGQAANATNITITMSNSNSCTNLMFSAAANLRTLTVSAGVTLNASGDLTMNQPSGAVTNTLTVGAGTCNVSGNLNFVGTSATTTQKATISVTTGAFTVNGNVSWMANTAVATELITVTSTGSITFGSPITMGTGSGTISATSTGTINFNGTSSTSFVFGGAATAPIFTTTNGCKINFANGFTNNTATCVFAATSTANFSGNGAITPTAAITFGNLTLSALDTLNTGGLTIVKGSVTLSTGSAFVANQALEVDGNWVNNGGTVNNGANAIQMNGAVQTIGGTSSTTFGTLQIGSANSGVTVGCTQLMTITCSNLVFHAGGNARTFTVTAGDTLNVTTAITMNQPTGGVTNSLSVNAGVCLVPGSLVFTGASNAVNRIATVAVTSGTFNLSGTVIWMANTAVATEVISVTTGNLIFGSSLAMGSGSATLSVTSSGTINFNGASAPSFAFGGAATAPVFGTAAGCTLNFNNGFTNSGSALVIATPSTSVFTASGTVTPTAAITFGDIRISSGATLTLGGNIALVGNWTDYGTFVPNSKTVTFSATSPNIQTVTKTGGETFYNITATNAGSTVKLNSNVTATNALTMSGPNFNLNANTLQLGSGAGASLTYTAGIVYGGTWKRWFPASAITSNSGSYYGLLPIGSSTDYRPVAVNTTMSPTTAGYVTAVHTDASTVTVLSYTDNEAAAIQTISDKQTALSTSGLAGGTYNVSLTFSSMSATGSLTDLKLETYTASVMGSVGASAATTGTVANPTVIRNGITMAQLSNTWVIGSKNKGATPLVSVYYSRKTGNWSDNSANSTWSNTSGGAGPSCNCTPPSGAYVVISAGQTVTADVSANPDYVDVSNAGILRDNSGITLTVNSDLTMYGSGGFVNTGTWTVGGNMTLTSTSVCTATGALSVSGNTVVPSGGSYTQTSGTLTLSGDATINGVVSIGSGTYSLTGNGSNISGTGSLIGTSGATVTVTNSKTILSGSNLVFGSSATPITFAISGAATISNNATVKVYGDLTGSVSGSTWFNNGLSSLEVTGNLLTTGTLNAGTSPNTVKYSGSAAQTILAPSSGYDNLIIANGGVKTLAGNAIVNASLTIQDSVIVDENIYALTGIAPLTMSGKTELKLVRSASGTYPELSGAYTLSGGMITINQTSGTATVNGAQYYDLKFNGSQAYDISGISKINNNLYLLNSSSITNNASLTVTDSFIYASTGSSVLTNNLRAGSFTISAGTFDDGGLKVTVTGVGSWNNNGGTYIASGSAAFSGTVSQQIRGSQATTFNNLTFNNTHGVTLNVNPAAATLVAGVLSMSKGIVTTDSVNILRLLPGSTSSPGSPTSYVDGPMVKVGADNFIFPVGNGGRWRRAGISGLTDPTTEVTAYYVSGAYPQMGPRVPELGQVSNVEYWMIDRQVSSDSLILQLFWEGASASNIQNGPDLTIAHYTGGQWNVEAATVTGGSSYTGGGSGSLQTTGYVTSFSPFTFGGDSGGTALPIKLVSFNATAEGKEVQTNWATQLELNNAYFTVERSADGVVFSEVGEVAGAGNSTSLLNYDLLDKSPLPGVSYYRLRQTDFNGQFSFSPVVAVEMKDVNNTEASKVIIYPNPAHDQVSVRVTKPSGQIQLKVFDISGWEVYAKTVTVEGDESEQVLSIPTGILLPGMYLVSTYSGKTESTQKLIIQ